MAGLSEAEKERLIACIREGKPLPAVYRSRLFGDGETEYVEATADYRLVYKGKTPKEQVIAQTPAAPLQLIRTFNADNPFEEGSEFGVQGSGDGTAAAPWRNLLIFGDNLLALKALLEDQRGPNRFHTRGRIRLVYIDPPFATRQDFMKDREKAYRDKVIGAQFIEFIRKRLILLRELLADDGFLFVHLDWKKGHYIKAVLDEVFDEVNFRNEIVLPRPFTKNLQQQFSQLSSLNVRHDTLLFYSKRPDTSFPPIWVAKEKVAHPDGHWHHLWSNADRPTMRFPVFGITPKTGQWVWSKPRVDEAIANYEEFRRHADGRSLAQYWRDTGEKLRFVRRSDNGRPQYWRAPASEKLADTLWMNLTTYENQKVYPTQKHEDFLGFLMDAFSNEGDIVLDAFMGSGTTPAVAEKLGRRWIGIDCGKLAVYTTQKRLLTLTTQVGSAKSDDRREHERVADFADHSKSGSRGLFLVYEKARRGDLVITDAFLRQLAAFVETHLSGAKTEDISLVCPEDKFRIRELEVAEDADGVKAGEQVVTVGRVRFLISFIQSKEKKVKPAPLRAKAFALYHAGIYDKLRILEMPWADYRPFVLQLFGVREERHTIGGIEADGYLGLHSALIWDYPNQRDLVLDHGYVRTLHEVMQGRAGDRFYVIAPGAVMTFMEDELRFGDTTYVLLKVPLSVLMALIERGETGSLPQPMKEEDVNAVIDAVGFDFISQPVVEAEYRRAAAAADELLNHGKPDFVVRLTDFRSNTLAQDPDDFAPFETFSMVLADTDYDGDTFKLTHVFWRDQVLNEEEGVAELRIPQDDVTGERLMLIYMDRYGNELKVVKAIGEFGEVHPVN